jgi:hypothetical protein
MTDKGDHRPLTAGDVREIRAYVEAKRAERTPFDIVVEGVTPGNKPKKAGEIVRGWADAGATWWIEALWNAGSAAAIRRRVEQGPPKI